MGTRNFNGVVMRVDAPDLSASAVQYLTIATQPVPESGCWEPEVVVAKPPYQVNSYESLVGQPCDFEVETRRPFPWILKFVNTTISARQKADGGHEQPVKITSSYVLDPTRALKRAFYQHKAGRADY